MRWLPSQSTTLEIEVRASFEQYIAKYALLARTNPPRRSLRLRPCYGPTRMRAFRQPIRGQRWPIPHESTALQSLERGL